MLRRDRTLTDSLYARGVLKDEKRRSFVAFWVHPGTSHRCEYLFGRDRQVRWRQVWQKANGFCELCETAHYIGSEGQWHHDKGGNGKQRCDCLENAIYACKESHRKAHVHPRWSTMMSKVTKIALGEAEKCGLCRRPRWEHIHNITDHLFYSNRRKTNVRKKSKN